MLKKHIFLSGNLFAGFTKLSVLFGPKEDGRYVAVVGCDVERSPNQMEFVKQLASETWKRADFSLGLFLLSYAGVEEDLKLLRPGMLRELYCFLVCGNRKRLFDRYL